MRYTLEGNVQEASNLPGADTYKAVKRLQARYSFIREYHQFLIMKKGKRRSATGSDL
jgi:hypothetical protein